MSYTESVLSRLMNPGVLLLVVGAFVVYGSGKLTGWIAPDGGDKAEKTNLIIKVAGTVLALGGALLVFLKS